MKTVRATKLSLDIKDEAQKEKEEIQTEREELHEIFDYLTT